MHELAQLIVSVFDARELFIQMGDHSNDVDRFRRIRIIIIGIIFRTQKHLFKFTKQLCLAIFLSFFQQLFQSPNKRSTFSDASRKHDSCSEIISFKHVTRAARQFLSSPNQGLTGAEQ
jgi:hypothetical protein